MKNKKYFNAMLESCYYEQIIGEACDGNMSFTNHFRRILTIQDCIDANVLHLEWMEYAKGVL